MRRTIRGFLGFIIGAAIGFALGFGGALVVAPLLGIASAGDGRGLFAVSLTMITAPLGGLLGGFFAVRGGASRDEGGSRPEGPT